MVDRDEVSGWDDDPRPTELMTSARDRVAIDERLDSGVRRGGRFARRHPWWVAGVVVVLAGSVAVGVYLANRPPPVDPEVAISIQSLGGGGQYVAVLRASGERVDLIGIVGPGLSDPTATMGAVTSNGPAIGNLGATIDCLTGEWWNAQPGEYKARVERTDAYGRVTTYDAALAETFDSWGDRVRRECLEKAVFTLPPATADVTQEADGAHLEVVVHLTNPNAFPIRAFVVGSADAAFFWDEGPPFEVPAGGSTDVSLRVLVSCAEGVPTLQGYTVGAATAEYSGPGITVSVDGGRTSDDGLFGSSVIPLGSAAEAAVNAAAADVCG